MAQSESIQSLPWILQSLATRLQDISRRLEAEEKKGLSLKADSKIVQEVLLATLATSDLNEREVMEQVLAILGKGR